MVPVLRDHVRSKGRRGGGGVFYLGSHYSFPRHKAVTRSDTTAHNKKKQ